MIALRDFEQRLGCDRPKKSERMQSPSLPRPVEMVRLLREFSAPVDIRDATYDALPVDWVMHG
jgi:hypothetical protein